MKKMLALLSAGALLSLQVSYAQSSEASTSPEMSQTQAAINELIDGGLARRAFVAPSSDNQENSDFSKEVREGHEDETSNEHPGKPQKFDEE